MNTSAFATEHSVSTVCPLDCPDSCSLDVRLQDGRITSIDGSSLNPVTDGYICAKVRKFPERVYGPDRLLYPAVRKGPKGLAVFQRASWDEALALIAERLSESREKWGGESILPYSYGGSNGLLTQDTSDATLFRRLGASRLARTVCAAATGAANSAMYGKMASVTYLDFSDARLIVDLGRKPLGHRHSPGAAHPRSAAPRRAAHRRRSPDDATGQTRGHSPRHSSRAPTCRWRSPSIVTCSKPVARIRSSSPPTRAARIGCARRRSRGRSSAQPAEAGIDRARHPEGRRGSTPPRVRR